MQILKYFLPLFLLTSSLLADVITKETNITNLTKMPSATIENAVNTYLDSIDFESLPVYKDFYNEALTNGNKIQKESVYVNSILFSRLNTPYEFGRYPYMANLDYCYLEIDANGNIVSILINAHYYKDLLGFQDRLVSFKVSGSSLKRLRL